MSYRKNLQNMRKTFTTNCTEGDGTYGIMCVCVCVCLLLFSKTLSSVFFDIFFANGIERECMMKPL